MFTIPVMLGSLWKSHDAKTLAYRQVRVFIIPQVSECWGEQGKPKGFVPSPNKQLWFFRVYSILKDIHVMSYPRLTSKTCNRNWTLGREPSARHLQATHAGELSRDVVATAEHSYERCLDVLKFFFLKRSGQVTCSHDLLFLGDLFIKNKHFSEILWWPKRIKQPFRDLPPGNNQRSAGRPEIAQPSQWKQKIENSSDHARHRAEKISVSTAMWPGSTGIKHIGIISYLRIN